MRWKLVIISSLIAALVALGLWCAVAIGLFGSASALARHDWLLLGSAALPLLVAAFGAVFVYRHTAKRRKLQATITSLLVLFLTVGLYFLAWAFVPARFYIPRAYEVRHAR